jgi:long-subunit acyl-CoA synthetase (AMP-forming)
MFNTGIVIAFRSTVSVTRENGSEELLITPVRLALSSQQAQQGRPECLSVKAALLELLAAATRAGIVAANTLEWVNKRLGCVGKGQTIIP